MDADVDMLQARKDEDTSSFLNVKKKKINQSHGHLFTVCNTRSITQRLQCFLSNINITYEQYYDFLKNYITHVDI